jgi:hypothetical protein
MSSASIPIGTLAIGSILRSNNILGMGSTNGILIQPAAPAINQPGWGKPQGPKSVYGQYNRPTYNAGTTDCAVTYTCEYGRGYDEVSYLRGPSISTSDRRSVSDL